MSSRRVCFGLLSLSLRRKAVDRNVYTGVKMLSSTAYLMSDRNKPRNSGDKGPKKNYLKKMMKKANKGDNTTSAARLALMRGLKAIESGESVAFEENDFILENERVVDSNTRVVDSNTRVVDSNTRREGDGRSQPQRKFEEDNRVLKKQSKPTLKPIHFMNPASGPRLGVFEPSDSNVEEMPCGSLNLTEKDKLKQLEDIHLLQTTSYFEDLTMESRVPYPRQFPIDNENYDHGESGVSFKDHVLLDHLLKDFPSKGPVRHFVELVVTGLSMNPDYSVTEKQEIVKWYREYFSQFTPEELQTLPSESLPSLDVVKTKRNSTVENFTS